LEAPKKWNAGETMSERVPELSAQCSPGMELHWKKYKLNVSS